MYDSDYLERYELAVGRIREIAVSNSLKGPIKEYFELLSCFLIRMVDIAKQISDKSFYELPLDKLEEINSDIYKDILPENYEKCFGNPDYIAKRFSEYSIPSDYARALCFLYGEERGLIPYFYEERYDIVVIYLELFIQIFNMFDYAQCMQSKSDDFECVDSDNEEIVQLVDADEEGMIALCEASCIIEAIYSFEYDNCPQLVRERITDQLDSKRDFATSIVMQSDLSDLRYLYYYGEYISDAEIESAKLLSTFSDDKIQSMAKTFVEGYVKGFIKAKKPLDKKKTVNIRYEIGFERVVKEAVLLFEERGLQSILYRAATLSVNKNGLHKIGYCSKGANRQYDYDHKDDSALYLDHDYVVRKLEALKKSYESLKYEANTHAGPAVQETYGESLFDPVNKKNAIHMDDNQNKLCVEYANDAGKIVNDYIKGDERSFTIITYPICDIGKDYKEIFEKTIELNNLDYELYQNMQQIIIDALDKADYVRIEGAGDNITDVTVKLFDLKNPDAETKFENCVADVNIPVGEVFTSPVLKGTSGVLNVSKVYLEGLSYENLTFKIEDGVVKDYSCDNFENEEDNRKLIKDNILFHHDTLPLGEFAIGTNTVAYAMARKYNIEDKLPILIGEKTGPHFALGDTCYSREEDGIEYNPDGKRIVARYNEISGQYKVDSKKAYFNCHTDITIPYDELKSIIAISEDGYEVVILKDGRFVLKGLEELNKPLN